MVYKIISDFQNFTELMTQIDRFDYIFANQTLYISEHNLSDAELILKTIKDFYATNCFIQEITEFNLKNEPVQIQEWCKKRFVEIDTLQYEKDNQVKMQNIMDILDHVEMELFGKILTTDVSMNSVDDTIAKI